MSDADATDGGLPRRGLLRAGAGAAAATASLSAAGRVAGQTEGASYGDWFADVDNYDGTTVDERGQSEVTVLVGAEGNGGTFAYAPPAIRVDPGTTVVFDWISDNHNVLVEDRPADAGWDGHQPIENTGFTYEHTFETEGVYLYYCEPHLPLGMKGAVVVGDVELAETGGGSEGGRGFVAPGGDIGLAFVLLVLGAAGLTAFSVLGAEFYRGLGRRTVEPAEVAEPAIERELGHDEFEPVGIAALIVVYFAILVLMWVFVYFVEFLGRGPTIVG